MLVYNNIRVVITHLGFSHSSTQAWRFLSTKPTIGLRPPGLSHTHLPLAWDPWSLICPPTHPCSDTPAGLWHTHPPLLWDPWSLTYPPALALRPRLETPGLSHTHLPLPWHPWSLTYLLTISMRPLVSHIPARLWPKIPDLSHTHPPTLALTPWSLTYPPPFPETPGLSHTRPPLPWHPLFLSYPPTLALRPRLETPGLSHTHPILPWHPGLSHTYSPLAWDP